MHRRARPVLVLLAVAAALFAFATGTADAATGTYLRLAHLSPDTPTVDVTLTAFGGGTLHLDGVSYGDVSTYQAIRPGDYTVAMRPAATPDAAPILTGTLHTDAGRAYTAAALGAQAGPTLRLLTDDLSLPGPGRARVRVVQGAQQAGPVDVTWNGGSMAGPVAFGTATGYVTVPAGHGTFGIAPSAGGPVTVPVDLAAGGVYSVIVVQRGGEIAGQVQTDALGTAHTPAGGIETGMGGMAGPSSPSPAVPPLGAAAALVVLTAALGWGLRGRVRR